MAKNGKGSTKVAQKVDPEAEAAARVGVVPSYNNIHGLTGVGFDKLISEHWRHSIAKKTAESKLREVNGKILALMKRAGAEKVMVGDDTVSKVKNAGQPKLDQVKLIELGCKPSWLEKATTREPYEYVLVTAPKESRE